MGPLNEEEDREYDIGEMEGNYTKGEMTKVNR